MGTSRKPLAIGGAGGAAVFGFLGHAAWVAEHTTPEEARVLDGVVRESSVSGSGLHDMLVSLRDQIDAIDVHVTVDDATCTHAIVVYVRTPANTFESSVAAQEAGRECGRDLIGRIIDRAGD